MSGLRLRPRLVAVGVVFVGAVLCALPSLAQRPYDAYLAATKRGVLERRVQTFLSGCVSGTAPRPQGFYSQGGWFATDNLPAQMRDDGADDDSTAYVWMVRGKPRAVYQWTHDDEFDRDLLACMDANGKVTHSISRYMPGTSEPSQRWTLIRTTELNQFTGHPVVHGRFMDWHNAPMGQPHMSREDEDFIAGERKYRTWADFDFAHLVHQ